MSTETNRQSTDLPEVALPESLVMDDVAVGKAVLREKLADMLIPGYQVEFDPEEAERVGAFREDALSELDAAGSTEDLAEVLQEPVFLDEDGPSADIPPFITTKNAHELYDLRPGETVSQASDRRKNASE